MGNRRRTSATTRWRPFPCCRPSLLVCRAAAVEAAGAEKGQSPGFQCKPSGKRQRLQHALAGASLKHQASFHFHLHAALVKAAWPVIQGGACKQTSGVSASPPAHSPTLQARVPERGGLLPHAQALHVPPVPPRLPPGGGMWPEGLQKLSLPP
jgi:hypothetical protein